MPHFAPSMGPVARHRSVLWWADPAARAVVHARGDRARDREILHHRHQRLHAFGEIRRLGGPVVHLGVDVDGVLRAPGRQQLVVPQALQVRRLRAGARTADEQVARVLEIQRRELRVVAGLRIADAHVGRLFARRRCRQFERHAAEQLLMVRDVRRAQRVESLGGRRLDLRTRGGFRIARHVIEAPEARGDGDEHERGVRAGHDELAVAQLIVPPCGITAHARLETQLPRRCPAARRCGR